MSQSREKDVLFHIVEPNVKEKGQSSKTRSAYKRMYLLNPKGVPASTTYAVSDVLDMRLYRSALMHIVNLDTTNNILYKVEACLDPAVKWEEVVAETTITANASGDASAVETISDFWAFVRVQYKSSAGSPKVKIIAGCRA